MGTLQQLVADQRLPVALQWKVLDLIGDLAKDGLHQHQQLVCTDISCTLRCPRAGFQHMKMSESIEFTCWIGIAGCACMWHQRAHTTVR